jgi:uncharacterized protein Veg
MEGWLEYKEKVELLILHQSLPGSDFNFSFKAKHQSKLNKSYKYYDVLQQENEILNKL